MELFILSYDPGGVTGVVGIEVHPRGYRLRFQAELLEQDRAWQSWEQWLEAVKGEPAGYRPRRIEAVVEQPPHMGFQTTGNARFHELQVLAKGHNVPLHVYLPGTWKPPMKRLRSGLPKPLKGAHLKDALGMALYHLRSQHGDDPRLPFLKEPTWHVALNHRQS